MTDNITVSVEEWNTLCDIASEARALLRALRAETAPTAHLAESIVTQHHMDRLAELTR